jgi:parallel beta helix pectate lyase-like protein
MRAIRFLVFLTPLMILLGCNSSTEPTSGPTTTEISGPIGANAAWKDTVRLTADADIAAGVHITMAAGTVFEGAQDAVLRVHGSLSINGTVAAPVSMEPMTGAVSWGGILVASGGVVAIHHATGSHVTTLLACQSGALDCLIDSAVFSDLDQAIDAAARASILNSDFHKMNNGGVTVDATGDLTLTDSVIWGAQGGDLLIVNGGKLTVSYCDIGSTAADSNEHGNLFISSASGISVTYSNIIGAMYGVMIGNTSNAHFEYDNFLSNGTDVSSLGNNVAGDMSFDYWENGAPSLGSEFVVGSPAPTPIASAGPRG